MSGFAEPCKSRCGSRDGELPFQMLLVLLERRGELVTKEELGKRLWDSKTYVEVDKSLYVMAGKLRVEYPEAIYRVRNREDRAPDLSYHDGKSRAGSGG